ncbi:abortive infection protein [Betaproteobacteria bacterium]|nr:abortive infection protein [Betaproteobacteria bacterium]GHU31115.1 abortive infection protein [Betaproteobacteria bacterium]
MIHTSVQLKALVRNMSKGNSTKAQVIIRNYVMERFIERLSLSPYRNNLILKGGTLVAAMVGLDNRSTLDVDATIKNLSLTVESAREVVEGITAVQIDDGMMFKTKSATIIMDEADYSGVRVMLDTMLETMRTPLKIDFSTGDVITPQEIEYSFRLLFEDRSVSILAYNLETVLAEKLETLLSRSTANTRMRDFYDIYVLETTQQHNIDLSILRDALANTSRKRGSLAMLSDAPLILDEIHGSLEMVALWNNYQHKFDYARGIAWDDVMSSVRNLYCAIHNSNPHANINNES